jgi:hypothetical protein
MERGVQASQENADLFAFRLRRIKVLLAEGKEHLDEDFNKGALLRLGEGGDRWGEEEKDLIIRGLEDFDASSDEFIATTLSKDWGNWTCCCARELSVVVCDPVIYRA